MSKNKVSVHLPLPIANRAFGTSMSLIDDYTPVNKLPIFDHMYSYYDKTS